MSDDSTKEMDGARPLLERILVRLDAMDEHLKVLDDVKTRLEILEEKTERAAMSTKPIWEQALKEIVETRRELSRRLDRIESIVHETRADLRDAEDRIDRLENKPAQ